MIGQEERMSEDMKPNYKPEIVASSEQVVMVPYLKNRADAVDGHYCIARLHPQGYHEFWNERQKKWCSAGSVFELY